MSLVCKEEINSDYRIKFEQNGCVIQMLGPVTWI